MTLLSAGPGVQTKKPEKCGRKFQQLLWVTPEAIRVTLSEKDLGIQMRYAAITHLGDAIARIQAGLERIRRLWHAPYTIEKKCSLVQTGVYPVMFFGAFGVYIGKKHFSKIRTMIGDAFLHRTTYSNPFLVW